MMNFVCAWWTWVKNCNRRIYTIFGIFSVIAGTALIVGRLLSDNGTLRNAGIIDAAVLAVLVVFIFLINMLIVYLLDMSKPREGIESVSYKRVTVCACILFVIWIPFFLAYYPTLWTYDIAGELPEIAGEGYDTHHPLFHQLYVQAIIIFSLKLTGGYEFGMVLLSLIQMAVFALLFGYCIELVRTWNRSRFLTTALFTFYGLLLFNPLLIISQTKDIPYTFCFIIILLGLIRNIDQGYHARTVIVMDVAAVVFMLNRKNGLFALAFAAIITTVVLLLAKSDKRVLTRIWINFFISSFLFIAINNALIKVYDAYPARKEMAFVVPLQCLTNIAANHPEVVPEYGTGGSLFGVIGRDYLPADLSTAYKYNWGWPVLRSWAAQPEENFRTAGLLKAWIVNGFRYPIDTIDGWGKLLLGTWYLFDTSHARIYEGPEFVRQGYLLTDFKIFSIFTERPSSKLPKLERFLEMFATNNVHQKIPVVALVFVPATYIWMTFFCMAYSIYKRNYKELIVISLLIGQYITVLLGPSMPVRYMWPIMTTAPILLARLIRKEKGEKVLPLGK